MLHWLLNTESFTFHAKELAEERCNLDDAEHIVPIAFGRVATILKRQNRWWMCSYCFGDGMEDVMARGTATEAVDTIDEVIASGDDAEPGSV